MGGSNPQEVNLEICKNNQIHNLLLWILCSESYFIFYIDTLNHIFKYAEHFLTFIIPMFSSVVVMVPAWKYENEWFKSPKSQFSKLKNPT